MNALTRILSELTEEQLKELYMRVFNNDDGRLVLEDLCNRCYTKVSSVGEGGIVDGGRAIFNEGRRSVVLHVETMLEPKEVKTEEVEA